jgi:alpha-L-fucosidase
MRKATNFILALVLISLYSCSGSDTYRGLWKALDERGEKFEINFEAKSFTIKDSSGKTDSYTYKQNSVSIKNSIATYGIQVSDGKAYLINFPIANDETKGVIKDAAGRPLYIIGRSRYVEYEEIYGLK